ncbi:hypothetical protein AAF712_014061 [Marasmius tenuissimus]|uniref:Uncharacterized protein n=1 Tax=Marasmius tenuissimus TaxID=585030 RepID=A0ABR2ZCZ2_9AGAR
MNLELWEIIKHRGDTIRKEQQSYTFYCSKTLRNELFDGLKANTSVPSWKKQMIQRGEGISEHVKELEAWSLTLRDERQADLQRRRKEREKAILQRLVDAGWGEEIEKQRQLNGLRIFREFKLGTQAKKLTDKGEPLSTLRICGGLLESDDEPCIFHQDWDELEPKLEAALERAKENRLTMEFRETWYRRYETFRKLVQAELNKLPFNTVGPNVFDLVNEPEFQAKLLSPIDHELTSGDMADVFDILPQIRARWVEDRQKDLVDLLKEHGVQDATFDTLHHASTTFTCIACAAACVYPRPLMHHCSRRLNFGFDQTRPSVQDFMHTMHGGPWNVRIFGVRKEAMMEAKKIMEICGIPATATLDEVKDSGCWVQRPDFLHGASGHRLLYPIVRAVSTSNSWLCHLV